MASMRDSMVRNLKHFVDYDLATIVPSGTVMIEIPTEHEGDVAELRFRVPPRDGTLYVVRIESPDFNPSNPNGCVLLDQRPIGPIDEVTWNKVAMQIKAERAQREIEASNGRAADGASV